MIHYHRMHPFSAGGHTYTHTKSRPPQRCSGTCDKPSVPPFTASPLFHYTTRASMRGVDPRGSGCIKTKGLVQKIKNSHTEWGWVRVQDLPSATPTFKFNSNLFSSLLCCILGNIWPISISPTSPAGCGGVYCVKLTVVSAATQTSETL